MPQAGKLDVSSLIADKSGGAQQTELQVDFSLVSSLGDCRSRVILVK